ncbi:NAD(P)H-binding protein [Muricauda sp. 334s03]|uniref:NAD(P)H-binding protein n=1 Tax=Flagellimonas yonaguniensis TaxID=3031325 RepID=A0ABT5XZ55_9FLAO|nr:NAD(P)H-binding protein [[Muricauda] yonaguniensis]MDF0716399.1 NAD(P)H-binding protein [[Muricauda] yonaguniensis]
MKKDNFLIIGGTGKTGRKVVDSLKLLNQNVRIGSRSSQPAFDWNNGDTWEEALEGVDKMYITYQPDLAVPGAKHSIENLINLAKKQHLKKVVLLSGKGEREAELCEQVVINSGLDYTIVRASWFSQNFSESFFLEPIQQGFVALPQADVPVPYVDTGDIADVVVEALLHEEHDGRIYQLTGPTTLSFKEAIAEIAKATDRDIAFTPITIEAYVSAMKEQGVPADFVWLVEYLFTEVLGNPMVSEITNDIEKVLKRKPKSFTDYVNETAITGVWKNGIPIA